MRDGFRLEHIKSGKDDWVPHWYPMKPKRATWAIYDVFGRKIIGTWRKLPSHFLRQLEKYQDGHPRTPLKGGL